MMRFILSHLYKIFNSKLQSDAELDLNMPFLVVYKFLAYIGIGFNTVFFCPYVFSAINL
jgi:hypothetical protein